MTERRSGRFDALKVTTETLIREARPRRLIPALTIGLVTGLIEVFFSVSFATLLLSGPFSSFIPTGVAILLFSSIVIVVVIGLLATEGGTIGTVQDGAAAVLVVITGSIAAGMPAGASPEAGFVTVVAAIALGSLLTAVVFLALGTFRLGELIRYVPYPVVGGFLAGSGWVLVQGSLGVMLDTGFTMADLPMLLAPELVVKWFPGTVFAIVLLLLLRRYSAPWMLPAGALVGIGLFYGALLASNTPVAEARAQGLLLGPFPQGGVWQPPTPELLAQVEWPLLAGQMGNLLVLVGISAIGLLLNAAGLELVFERDLDLDRELRVAGFANLLSGLGGGMTGFHALSASTLTHKAGVKSRLVPVVSALVCGVVLIIGTEFVSFFPRAILTGLIMTLGLSFLAEWLYDARSDLSLAEYLILLLIVIIIGFFGFLEGVAAGFAAALVLFIVNYSQVDVVKHTLSGSAFASNVDRPEQHRLYLRSEGRQAHILKLQGYIFFGTANRILEEVKERANAPEPMRYAILDLQRVTGVDSSVMLSLSRLLQMAEERDFYLVFTDPTPQIEASIERELRPEDDQGRMRVFSDLDHGLEWCEQQILAASDLVLDHTLEGLEQLLRRVLPVNVDASRLMSYMERQEVPEGEVLLREGDAADDMYFIEQGRLTVQLEIAGDDPLRLRTMQFGNVVGEMGMYLNEERSASVVADEPCIVYRLTASALEEMKASDPELAAAFHEYVARLLADRLANNNRLLSTLLE